MFLIFIWQNQCEANTCTWFFLGRHFAKRKRSKPCIFVFKQSRQIQNWQPNSDKKYCHSLQRNYQKKLKKFETFPRFQWWMKKTNILRRVLLSWGSGNFWNRNWNRYHQKTIDDFINQQKIEILFFIVPKVDKVTTTFGLNTFQYLSISTWNSLSHETRSAPDLNTFKRCIKQLTFKKWLHI